MRLTGYAAVLAVLAGVVGGCAKKQQDGAGGAAEAQARADKKYPLERSVTDIKSSRKAAKKSAVPDVSYVSAAPATPSYGASAYGLSPFATSPYGAPPYGSSPYSTPAYPSPYGMAGSPRPHFVPADVPPRPAPSYVSDYSDVQPTFTTTPAPLPAPSRHIAYGGAGAYGGAAAGASHNAGPGRNYLVQKGDTLFRIAHTHYGNGNQWARIASANPGLSPDTLKAGATIVVP